MPGIFFFFFFTESFVIAFALDPVFLLPSMPSPDVVGLSAQPSCAVGAEAAQLLVFSEKAGIQAEPSAVCMCSHEGDLHHSCRLAVSGWEAEAS